MKDDEDDDDDDDEIWIDQSDGVNHLAPTNQNDRLRRDRFILKEQ